MDSVTPADLVSEPAAVEQPDDTTTDRSSFEAIEAALAAEETRETPAAEPVTETDQEPPAADPRDAELAALKAQIADLAAQHERIARALQPRREERTSPPPLTEKDLKIRERLRQIDPDFAALVEHKDDLMAAVAYIRESQQGEQIKWADHRDVMLRDTLTQYAKLRFGEQGTPEQVEEDDRDFVIAAFREYVTATKPDGSLKYPERAKRYERGDQKLVEEFVEKFEGRRQANVARSKAADKVRQFDKASKLPRAVRSATPAPRGPKPAEPETIDDVVGDAWKFMQANRGA